MLSILCICKKLYFDFCFSRVWLVCIPKMGDLGGYSTNAPFRTIGPTQLTNQSKSRISKQQIPYGHWPISTHTTITMLPNSMTQCWQALLVLLPCLYSPHMVAICMLSKTSHYRYNRVPTFLDWQNSLTFPVFFLIFPVFFPVILFLTKNFIKFSQ